jgi:aspartyl-tRNA(Asn)/glutamyl-tRNA(Gln) amidotransferase subunit C
MSLSLNEVERIASLARLALTDTQKERYRVQLEAILDHVAKLQGQDTTDVTPTASVSEASMPLRPDEPRQSLSANELLKNAPEQQDGQFKIPPVFD